MRNTLAFLSLLTAACTATTPVDDLADESADGELGKNDLANEAFTFFFAEPNLVCDLDFICQGFRVSRPNRSTTICSRGVEAESCLVEKLDWSAMELEADMIAHYEQRIRLGHHVLLRGEILPAADDRGASLKIRQVWLGGSETGVIEGVGVLLKPNDVRCITAPCPSLTEYKLNSNQSAEILDVDLLESGADAETVAYAQFEYPGAGVIVFGDRTVDGGGPSRSVNQFFTRVPSPSF